MRKRCKRKVYQLMNPINLAIEGACITPDKPLSELQRGEKAYLDALLSGGLFALTIGLALVSVIFLLNLG